ncbi:hypothetical protein LINPERHAP2_LOCUS26887 [Linum perenne]
MDRIRSFSVLPDPTFQAEQSSNMALQMMSNETLQRELEKARNGLDLIALELLRLKTLEAEVRRRGITLSAAKKPAMEEWICSCCHVSCNCWKNFEQHLMSRKHKVKEEALRVTRKSDKNHSRRIRMLVSAKYHYLA